MRKRLFLYIGLLGLAVFMTGCGNKEEVTTEATEEITEETTEATTELTTEEVTTEEEIVKIIGTQETGAYEIHITNATGKPIQEIVIKASDDTEYSENLLEEGDVFAEGEERILYYKDDVEQNKEGVVYDIQLTFENEDVFELHDLPFDDFTTCELCFDDEIAFVSYESVNEKMTVSTKDNEYAYQTLPLQPGEYPVTTVPTTQAPTTEAPTTQTPTTEVPTTQAPTTEAPTTQAPTTEAPATQAPTTEAPATQAPTTEAPATQAPTTQAATEGCLDDGLFY